MPKVKTEFYGKIWIFAAQAVVFGMLGLNGLILGPLFLFEIMLDAKNQPATGAGIAMSIFGVLFFGFAILATFNVIARRKPVLKLTEGGLEVRRIGALPGVLAILSTAWAIISREGFKQRVLIAPYEGLTSVRIGGPPMSRTLSLSCLLFEIRDSEPIPAGNNIVFQEVEFSRPLSEIAEAINSRIVAETQSQGL